MCLQNSIISKTSAMLLRNNNHISLYKSDQFHISVNTNEISNGVNQKKIKSSSKQYVI